MAPPRPARQVCPICAQDDDVEILLAGDEWVMTCSYQGHLPFEWRPKGQFAKAISYRTGIGEELGVYDDLLVCVREGIAEYGVIEYRYWQRSPDVYRQLVDRYGHTAKGPSRYTASAFLGGALGHLWREELIEGVWGPATGYWSYNGQVGSYGPPGTAETDDILSWETFAEQALGVDPFDWPPLGYRNADD